jgi:hypothetical protein
VGHGAYVRAELPDSADPKTFNAVLTWWSDRVEELGYLPGRRDLKPEDLPAKALPNIMLAEFIGSSDRVRFRLVGSAIVDFNQIDFTGRYLDEIYPSKQVFNFVVGLYQELKAKRRPIWSVNAVKSPSTGQHFFVHRLMAPLATNGHEVDMVLAVQKFSEVTKAKPVTGSPWFQASDTGEQERVVL